MTNFTETIIEFLRPTRTGTFVPPYALDYHHEFDKQNLANGGYQRFTSFSWRKPNEDTPPEKIDPKSGMIKIPGHDARDVSLPKGAVALAPAQCKVLLCSEGDKADGGSIKLEFFLIEPSTKKPKKYFMRIAHIDDITVKKGDVIDPGTQIGTAHFIPRTGQTMLCIKVYDERDRPVDYLKLVGTTLSPYPVSRTEPQKRLTTTQ